MPANRSQAILKIPVILKHTEQQNDGWFVVSAKCLEHQALVTNALGLIVCIIDGKLHNDNIRLDCPVPQHIPIIADNAQL